MDEIIVYTDGACSGNPGKGGWACVILYGENEIEICGGEKNTTNNRMELMAAISALSRIDGDKELKNLPIKIFTDSQYVKNGITTWIARWKKNSWRTADKKPVKNQDLWQALDDFVQKLNVIWDWVKGHNGDKYNEICDKLATNQAKSQ